MHKREEGDERRDVHIIPRCTRERKEMKGGQRREARKMSMIEKGCTHNPKMHKRGAGEKHSMSSHISTFDMQT